MDYAPINIQVSKASIDGQVYDVLSYDEYVEQYQFNKDRTDIAVKEEYEDKTILLPYRGKYTRDRFINPGIYNAGSIDFVKRPTEDEIAEYTPDKIVSLSNASDIEEILKNAATLRKLDEPYLTTPDNVTEIKVQPDDQPEMKCLKMAINAKHIDLDKYASRFGVNFPNDKRQLKSNNITLNIIKRYCENCDMEAILTLKDSAPDVPNPIGREISVSLTELTSEDE